MRIDRNSLRYTVGREGAAVRAHAYDSRGATVGTAVIKDPDHDEMRRDGFEVPLVSLVDVPSHLWENGIGSRVLDHALAEYPAGTEFLYHPADDRGALLMESVKRRHPEFTFSPLPPQ